MDASCAIPSFNRSTCYRPYSPTRRIGSGRFAMNLALGGNRGDPVTFLSAQPHVAWGRGTVALCHIDTPTLVLVHGTRTRDRATCLCTCPAVHCTISLSPNCQTLLQALASSRSPRSSPTLKPSWLRRCAYLGSNLFNCHCRRLNTIGVCPHTPCGCRLEHTSRASKSTRRDAPAPLRPTLSQSQSTVQTECKASFSLHDPRANSFTCPRYDTLRTAIMALDLSLYPTALYRDGIASGGEKPDCEEPVQPRRKD